MEDIFEYILVTILSSAHSATPSDPEVDDRGLNDTETPNTAYSGDIVEGAAASGQHISHLFGPGTNVSIGLVWFLGLFLDLSSRPCGISEKNKKSTEIDNYFKFLTTADVF